MTEATENTAVSRQRIPLVDALRGVAIVAMVVYHTCWDLYYTGIINTNVIEDPAWLTFQRSIVVLFLLLVGAGLVLGHGAGIRWPAFWRRFRIVAGAALLTTVGTAIVFPDYFVYFGILHAIALFSLMGLWFLDKPPALVGLVAALSIFPTMVWQHPVMASKALSWIGFWPYPPETTDIVPVFPWFGVVLLGILGTRLLRASLVWDWVARQRLAGPVGVSLRFLGRWSLLIYLLHQPVIFGLVNWIATMLQPQVL
ncbi:MAG TPA: heparan-alpha-glucosaminide N-acetyltransferase [Devosia sp.]|nr:heparan-alpha-glucosaminide N-acetyltransferase [Devosia sp.]